jgi:hypothetical protein
LQDALAFEAIIKIIRVRRLSAHLVGGELEDADVGRDFLLEGDELRRKGVIVCLNVISFHGCFCFLGVAVGTAKHAVLAVFGLFLSQSDAAG